MPGTVLGAEDAAENETALMDLTVERRQQADVPVKWS